MRYRIEKDKLGEMQVPAEAYYGIHTLRSRRNFQISKRPINRQMIKGLANVKRASAKANYDAGLLKKDVCDAIVLSCNEILNGRLHGQFITDLIQGGAGTSMNMNANEVIANRANEMLGSQKGKYDKVHPIDDVNLSQSANDVVPTAGKIATIRLTKKLLVEMKKLATAYRKLGKEHKDVYTFSKTHLLDNVPISFGKIFNAMGSSVDRSVKKVESAMANLLEVNLGGTSVGLGHTTNKVYTTKVIEYLCEFTNEKFHVSKNPVDTTRHLDSFAWLSASIKTFALNINKHANDLRLISSSYGLVELPEVQLGSVSYPGKVNPVIPEMVNQVVFYMEGNDLTISRAVASGELDLNVNLPIILACLFENLNFIRRAIRALREKALEGLEIVDQNIDFKADDSIITIFLQKLGYEKSQEVISLAKDNGKTVLEVIVENDYLSKAEVDKIFIKEAEKFKK